MRHLHAMFFFSFNTGMGWTGGNKCPFSYVQVNTVITIKQK